MAQRGKGARSKTGRKPHNAKQAPSYGSFEELLMRVAHERRVWEGPRGPAEMTRAERSLRRAVERAMRGKVRDVAHVIRLMIKYPEVSASYRERQVIYLGGAIADL